MASATCNRTSSSILRPAPRGTSAPLLGPDPLARHTQLLQQLRHLIDERRWTAHETECLPIVHQRLELAACDASACAGPVPGTDVACHRHAQFDGAGVGHLPEFV